MASSLIQCRASHDCVCVCAWNDFAVDDGDAEDGGDDRRSSRHTKKVRRRRHERVMDDELDLIYENTGVRVERADEDDDDEDEDGTDQGRRGPGLSLHDRAASAAAVAAEFLLTSCGLFGGLRVSLVLQERRSVSVCAK